MKKVILALGILASAASAFAEHRTAPANRSEDSGSKRSVSRSSYNGVAAPQKTGSSKSFAQTSGQPLGQQWGWSSQQQARQGNAPISYRRVAAEPTHTEPPPNPNDYPGLNPPVPGALIRSANMGYKTQPAARPFEYHSVEAGGMIAQDEGRALGLTNHKGVFLGPKDKMPNANGGSGGDSGGASGKNSITENK